MIIFTAQYCLRWGIFMDEDNWHGQLQCIWWYASNQIVYLVAIYFSPWQKKVSAKIISPPILQMRSDLVYFILLVYDDFIGAVVVATLQVVSELHLCCYADILFHNGFLVPTIILNQDPLTRCYRSGRLVCRPSYLANIHFDKTENWRKRRKI